MIVWFWKQIISSYFDCVIYGFSHFPWFFRKLYYSTIFFIFLSSAFTSVYDFSQISWINQITLGTFLKTNPWYRAWFNVFMCTIHSFYHASWLQVFRFSFFQAKMVNQCEGHVIFQDIEHQLQQNILKPYPHCSFLWNLY